MLVRSINEEADLTTLGRWIQKRRIEGALATRLRVEELIRRRHPEIHEIDLGSVVVIAGLQRTGTTTLHRLIASHPEIRAVTAWEGLNPLPLPREAPGDPHARIRQALIGVRAIAYLAPAFFAVHPAEHDAPEEDVLLLDVSFMSQSAEATMHVPTYARWLEEQDHTRTYEEFRTLLQVLHWQRPRRHSVLKTPHHMEYLDTVLEVFPRATIVQTHRDPLKSVPSFCSMVAHGRGMFSDRVEPGEIGAHWFAKTCRLVERTARAREVADPRRFVDISYYDLVSDPMAQFRRRSTNGPAVAFGPGRGASAAERTAGRNVQHRYGRHVYDADSFGLTREAIEHGIAPYRHRHSIPHE